ncbi:MAG: DNA polymerase III subunit chi [Ottowia sp.]|nr:DNA polymerase III subunit chi [Ottowia sp.]
MTRVDFHCNVVDRLAYICRLVRKVFASGAHLVVLGSEAELDVLDAALWTFSQVDFVPHCFGHHPLASQTPVILATHLDDLPRYHILLNIGEEVPALFARFERLLEVVGLDESERVAARVRYLFYRDRGYPLHNFDQKAIA